MTGIEVHGFFDALFVTQNEVLRIQSDFGL